jgi:hypothetical protein
MVVQCVQYWLLGYAQSIHVAPDIFKDNLTTIGNEYFLTLYAIVEVIGWAGRTWSSKCPYNSTAFLMQISTLIIGEYFWTLCVLK